MDHNYETDPLPLSPWFYRHALLPGRDFPGVPGAMSRAGKQFPEPAGR
ncbi:hypothetical protein [Amycolatopsis sp. NPDC004625]